MLTKYIVGVGSLSNIGLLKIGLNLVRILIIYSIVNIVTLQVRWAVILSGFLLMVFATLNHYVATFRGMDILPTDLFLAGTAVNVAGGYNFAVTWRLAYAWIVYMLFGVASFCVKGETTRKGIIKKRISTIVVCGILMIVLWGGVKNIDVMHWGRDGATYNGFILNFVSCMKEAWIEKPKNYNEDRVNEIISEYAREKTKPDTLPNILVVMNESFADFRVLNNTVYTNESVTPFLDNMKSNTIKGFALSGVYGGNTPNSEFEFLTSNSMAFLPYGSIPYQQYLSDNTYSMVSVLKDYGYKCIAMHPYRSDGWMRETVWPSFGFEETYFLDDFKQEKIVRDYVSDLELYEKIIEKYEQKDIEEKLFLFSVTMQNHGGYDWNGEGFINSIELEGYDENYPDAEQYLSLVHELDRSLEYLITYFEEVEEDVLIIFFGDHYPALNSNFYEEAYGEEMNTLDERQLQYTVPFFVWANYDIEEEFVECTRLNYLANYVYRSAKIQSPTYNAF